MPVIERLPPTVLVMFAVSSVQFGSALAKTLFDQVGPGGTVFLRLALAALVLTLIWRPTIKGHGRRDLWLIFWFGACLAGMNMAFYASLDRIPPGPHLTFVVGEEVRDPSELDAPGLTRWDPWLAASEGSPAPLPAAPDELRPVEPRKILAATWRAFLLLLVLAMPGAGSSA